MSLPLILNQPQVAVGLPTYAYTIPTGGAGLYNVHVELSEVPPTGLSLLIKKGASTVYTMPTISPTQIAIQLKQHFLFADADAITVVLASSDSIDNQKNTVKSTCTIAQGAN